MGLPVPEDMKGHVLKEIFEPGFWEKYPVQTIKSYENYMARKAVAVSADALNKEKIDMLRALGYIQ